MGRERGALAKRRMARSNRSAGRLFTGDDQFHRALPMPLRPLSITGAAGMAFT